MNNKSEKFCAVCGKVEGLKSCGSCLAVSYCSREHQVANWKDHKTFCNQASEVRLEDVNKSMRTLSVHKLNSKDAVTMVYGKQQAVMEGNVRSDDSHEIDSHSHSHMDSSVPDTPVLSRKLPTDLPAHISRAWLIKTSSDVVTCLRQYGIAVVNRFLGEVLGDKILMEVEGLKERHLLRDGETARPRDAAADITGSSDDPHSKNKYRMDKVTWVDGESAHCINIGTLIKLIDNIILSAQDGLKEYHIHGRTPAMVACYPGHGSCYVKHVDNPCKDGRLLTCIYYLNKDWNCKVDGGMLKIYPEGTTRVASIEPLMDRLLIFWSDKRNPHEVLPAYRTRFAVTVWYFDRDERAEAKKLASERLADERMKKEI